MRSSLRRWGASQLLLAWIAYWLVLIGVTLGRGLLLAWQLSRPGVHGRVTAGFDDGVLRFTVENGARAVWTGAASVSTVALWLAGPPLLLWLVWLVLRPRRGDSRADRAPGFVGPGYRRPELLGAPDPIPEPRPRGPAAGVPRPGDPADRG